MREKYIEESFPPWSVDNYRVNGDTCEIFAGGLTCDWIAAGVPFEAAKRLVADHAKMLDKLKAVAKAFAEANPEAFRKCWYGAPPATLPPDEIARLALDGLKEMAMSKEDPVSGGLVKAPAGVDERRVLAVDGRWLLRTEIADASIVREFGGCCLLGSGQMIPIEAAKQ